MEKGLILSRYFDYLLKLVFSILII